MTVEIRKNMLHLVCDGCGWEQNDGTLDGEIPGEPFRGWTWWDAPETPEDIFRAVTYCPRCASYIRTREDGSKYDIREEEDEEEDEMQDMAEDELFKGLVGASLFSADLPDWFIEKMAEDYLRELAGMKKQLELAFLLPASAEARRETLAFVVMHVEAMLCRTSDAIQAQERGRAKGGKA